MYSLDKSLDVIDAEVDRFLDSGLYDLMRRDHYNKMEELGKKMHQENLHLNEQEPFPHGNPLHAHAHYHESHPDVGQMVGNTWPFPGKAAGSSRASVAAGVILLFVGPVIAAVGLVKFALVKGEL
tara:strand:- start:384 stop:758 length:375 start_codon:yes stop_codon:yes gene_type:complete